jgi:hypothetical protein
MVISISSHRGPVGEPGREIMYRGFQETDEGYVEMALEAGISLLRDPAEKPGRGLVYCRL